MTSASRPWYRRTSQLIAGGLTTILLFAAVALFSQWPAWQSMAGGSALLRLSFTHSGQRVCRDRTEEELARLPPNMRAPQLCERRRSPVWVSLDIDGNTVFSADLPPSGLSGSGPSRVYERFVLPAGQHRVTVRMRDNPLPEGMTREGVFEIEMRPADSVAIDYDPSAGAFFLH